MRTQDKEVVARRDRLLVHFKGHLKMRSSIARGALALLSVAAITGCQSGSTWSPTWWNPFHTTSSTASPTSSVGAPPTRPSSLAYSSTASGYGSGTTANPYSPYSSSTAPSGYGTAPASPYSPGGYNATTPSS